MAANKVVCRLLAAFLQQWKGTTASTLILHRLSLCQSVDLMNYLSLPLGHLCCWMMEDLHLCKVWDLPYSTKAMISEWYYNNHINFPLDFKVMSAFSTPACCQLLKHAPIDTSKENLAWSPAAIARMEGTCHDLNCLLNQPCKVRRCRFLELLLRNHCKETY